MSLQRCRGASGHDMLILITCQPNVAAACTVMVSLIIMSGCKAAGPTASKHNVAVILVGEPRPTLEPGEPAPDFVLPLASGSHFALRSRGGKPTALAFFCGCDRCRAAATLI